ncbi:MAG TPA: HAMP domain-containing sensor histidine kinase [Polyangia bacterium]|jgi:signal transduction histidine kinase|nr:HAMP domain-containing sensor histidine kinase [Polyangia bacterium]
MSDRAPNDDPKDDLKTPAVLTADAAEAQQVLGMVAHEIKNLLGPLAMTLQLCERRAQQGEPAGKEDLAFARAQVQRLSQLVTDLLDTTRIDAGHFPIHLGTVDLGALVQSALESFRRVHPRRVVTDIPTETMAITGDGERLAAVLANFLDNAAKYSPETSPIEVRISRAGGRVRVAVVDGGPGISAEDQTRLFQRYFRSAATAEKTRGLGLGLYISRLIAERHGGTVGVTCAPGRGTTFWLELPLGQS